MKQRLSVLVVILLVASLTLALMSCGGGSSGDSSPSNTEITSSDQGAKAASMSASAVQGIVDSNGMFLDLQGFSSPQITIPGSEGSNLGKMFKKVHARFSPTLKKARVMGAAPTGGPCADGGDISVTASNTSATLTFNDCREMGESVNGTISISANADGSAVTMTVGSAGSPVTFTEYVQDDLVVGYEYVTEAYQGRAAATVVITAEQANQQYAVTLTSRANGYFEGEDFLASPQEKERLDMSNYRLLYKLSYINGVATADITANGSVSGTYSEDDGTGYAVVYGESVTFTNLNTVWQDTGTQWVYSINGKLTVDLTPDNACIEGTYTFVTNAGEEVTYNYMTGQFEGGIITINGNTVIEYQPNGDVTVTIDGVPQTYLHNDFDNLCPLL